MRGTTREITRFVGCAAAAWLLFGTGVLQASDDPVAQVSQGDSTTQAKDPPVPRRWQQPLEWERPPAQPGAAPPRHDYTDWLIGSYVAFPLLAIGAPVLVDGLWESETATAATLIVAPALAFSLPMGVHWAHGDTSRALRAILAYPLLTAGGVVVGGLLGANLTTARDRMESDGDAPFVNGIKGALIGGSAAIIGWALYDIVETSSSFGEHRRAARAEGASFAVLPYPHGAVASLAGRF